jgi:8-oxo-dGTP pyrophosphatase MutT (NUDIX family)
VVEHQEVWQVFNNAGLPMSGASIAPKESRGNSKIIVGAVHAWIWRKVQGEVEILLQHRAKDKRTWPDYLDISVAGHVDAGESLGEAITREAQEEVGAGISEEELDFVFSCRNFENGIKWVYILQKTKDVHYSLLLKALAHFV